jgi:hypothetical protein
MNPATDEDLGPEIGGRLVPEIGIDQIIPAEAVFDALADEQGDAEPTLDQIRAMAEQDDAVRAAAGHDVTPGHDELHHYWVAGPGLARWAGSPTPWTTLLKLLVEHVKPPKPLEVLKRFASRWYIEVFHYSAGSDKARVAHGKPPRGKIVGPG